MEEAEVNIKDAIRGVPYVMDRDGQPYLTSEKGAFTGKIAV